MPNKKKFPDMDDPEIADEYTPGENPLDDSIAETFRKDAETVEPPKGLWEQIQSRINEARESASTAQEQASAAQAQADAAARQAELEELERLEKERLEREQREKELQQGEGGGGAPGMPQIPGLNTDEKAIEDAQIETTVQEAPKVEPSAISDPAKDAIREYKESHPNIETFPDPIKNAVSAYGVANQVMAIDKAEYDRIKADPQATDAQIVDAEQSLARAQRSVAEHQQNVINTIKTVNEIENNPIQNTEVAGNRLVVAKCMDVDEAHKVAAQAYREGKDCICTTMDGHMVMSGHSAAMQATQKASIFGVNEKMYGSPMTTVQMDTYDCSMDHNAQVLYNQYETRSFADRAQLVKHEGIALTKAQLMTDAEMKQTLDGLKEQHQKVRVMVTRENADGSIDVACRTSDLPLSMRGQYNSNKIEAPAKDMTVMHFNSKAEAAIYVDACNLDAFEQDRVTENASRGDDSGHNTPRVDDSGTASVDDDYGDIPFGE